MLGDLRVLDVGDELLLDTERVDAAGAVQHDPALQARPRRRAAQAHARAGAAVARRPGRAARGGRRRAPAERARQRAAPRSPARRSCSSATDVGVDVFAPAGDARRRARRARGCRRRAVTEEAAETLRVEHGRPRYGVDLDDEHDPAGGRPERARGVVHQGLLRRAGDRRPAVLPRQAEPPPARPAAVGARRAPATRCGSARRRSAALGSVAVSPGHGPIALAIVRREAAPGDTLTVGDGGTTAEVVELPFRQLRLLAG